MHAIMGVGIIGLVGKLHKWDESAMFFDGSCIGAQCHDYYTRFSYLGIPIYFRYGQALAVKP